ncbi:hypothetical protein Tco_1217609 [Tanacetum coccineum]
MAGLLFNKFKEDRVNVLLTNDLDAYDSDCDDISSAKLVLMANLSSCGSDTLSKKDQWIKTTLYDGIVISKKHDVISVVDEEETLILEEESRSKMLAKQNDPISKEKKINISLINYNEIKRLIDDLRVTAAQLMLLVYKLLLLVLKVNTVSTKVTTAQRLRLLKEFLLSEDKDRRKDKDCLEIKIT